MGECSACSGQQVDSRVAVVVTNHNHNPNALVRCKYFALQLGGTLARCLPQASDTPAMHFDNYYIHYNNTVVIVVFE